MRRAGASWLLEGGRKESFQPLGLGILELGLEVSPQAHTWFPQVTECKDL